MADTPTTSGKYRKQGLGDRSAAWGLSSGLNGVFDSLDEAIHGVNVVSLATTNYTLTSTNYTSNEVRQRFHRFSNGGISAQPTITVPAVDNWWIMANGVTGQSILVSNGANSVAVADGQTAIVSTDGTNMYAFPFATSLISADPGANGVVVRTLEGVTTARTLTGTAEQITVTHGNGVSGNPTISLPTRVRIGSASATASAALNIQAAVNVEVPRNSGDTFILGTTTSKNAAERLTLMMASNADGDGNDLRAAIELGTVTSNDALGSDSYISFYTNNYGASRDVRVHIDKDGNTGIGTTAPAALLDVRGNVAINGNDLIIDADGDSYLHESSDDVIQMVAGSTVAATFTTGGINGVLGATTPAAITGTTVTASTEFRGTVLTSNSTSAVQVKTSGGVQAQIGHIANTSSYIQLNGNTAGNGPQVRAVGSDTNIDLQFLTAGTGSHRFGNTAGALQLRVANTASAVEYLQITGAASGGSPTLSAQGSSSNIPVTIANKGTAVTKLTGQTVQTTVGSAGAASALPATPTGYIVIGINGTDRVIPYYAAS